MYSDYLFEKLDDIIKILDGKVWVSSYQVFLQSIKSLQVITYMEDMSQFTEKLQIGMTVRTISDLGKYNESSFSISEISKLSDLKPNSGIELKNKKFNFPKLKKPNKSSISGDFSNSVDMNSSPYQFILNKAYDESNRHEIPFQHEAKVNLENRLIKNSNSVPLSESSLRTDYSALTKFEIYDRSFILSRNTAGRSLGLNIKKPISEIASSIQNRITYKPEAVDQISAILFHPDVIGSLISYTYSMYYSHYNEKNSNTKIWDDNFQLYDDPLHTNGYYSTLFDDEGNLTSPTQLIYDGEINASLTDYSHSGWDRGGNGYRVKWFEPNLRSYSYQVVPSVTNLVVTGGVGKGVHFTERPGKLLVIRNAQGHPSIGSYSSQFLLHVNEAEIWKDGEYLCPADDLTLFGDMDEIMTKGQLSSDQLEVISSTIGGSIYSGWLIIPASIVKIRS